MVRRYGDPVHVRPDDRSGQGGLEPPDSFLWRGRLYVVRSVLGHWRERRSWWAEGAALALHGEDDAAHDAAHDPAPAAESEVWRVEAGCGRAAGLGVYDLRHDERSWSLVRVSD